MEDMRTVVVKETYRYILCDPCYLIANVLLSAGRAPTLTEIGTIKDRSKCDTKE